MDLLADTTLLKSYFGKQTTPKVILNFYDEVASKSLLPIVSTPLRINRMEQLTN